MFKGTDDPFRMKGKAKGASNKGGLKKSKSNSKLKRSNSKGVKQKKKKSTSGSFAPLKRGSSKEKRKSMAKAMQASLGRKRKSIVEAGQAVKARSSDLMKTLGRKPRRKFTITQDMMDKSEIVLPPRVPESLDGTNERDVSLYASTWDMSGVTVSPNLAHIAYWLPLGYDIYVIALQSCKRIASIVPTIIEHLEKKFERYEEYTHFLPVDNEGSAKAATSLVLLMFVHTSCLEERVFRKRSPKMVHLREGIENDHTMALSATQKVRRGHGGSAIMVEVNVFDSTLLIVNAQLTSGRSLTGERIKDLQMLMKHFDHAKADHILLLGDMATTNNGDGQHIQISDYFKNSSTAKWSANTFMQLTTKYDEVTTVLKAAVPQFREFTELEIAFPPTNKRILKPKFQPTREGVAELFHDGYDLEYLYNYKEELPSYPSRVMWKTVDKGLKPCLAFGKSGACEGVAGTSSIPVFTTFRVGARSFGKVTLQKESRFASQARAPSTTSTTISGAYGDDDLPPPPKRSSIGTLASDFEGDAYLRDALGKLMENLGRKNNNTNSQSQDPGKIVKELHGDDIGVCGNCYAPIQGGKPHFEASGKLYHKGCFNCVFCDNPIQKKYYMINDELYCEDDYMDLFNPVCQGDSCGERIDGPFVKTETGAYHPDCFRCHLCDTALAEFKDGQIKSQQFAYRRNHLLCMEHAAEMDGRYCFVCEDTIVDEHAYETIVSSGEILDLHKECFKCSECGVNIAEQEELSYKIEGNKVLCAEHGGMMCGKCNQPIPNSTGHTAVMNVKYHSYCTPHCVSCKKKVGSDCVQKPEGVVCFPCSQKTKGGKIIASRLSAKRGGVPLNIKRKESDVTVFTGIGDAVVESGPRHEISEYSIGIERNPRMSLMSFSGYDLPPPPPPPGDDVAKADDPLGDAFGGFVAPPPPPEYDDDEPPPPSYRQSEVEQQYMKAMGLNGMMNELSRLTHLHDKKHGNSSGAKISLPQSLWRRDSDGQTTLAPPDIEEEY